MFLYFFEAVFSFVLGAFPKNRKRPSWLTIGLGPKMSFLITLRAHSILHLPFVPCNKFWLMVGCLGVGRGEGERLRNQGSNKWFFMTLPKWGTRLDCGAGCLSWICPVWVVKTWPKLLDTTAFYGGGGAWKWCLLRWPTVRLEKFAVVCFYWAPSFCCAARTSVLTLQRLPLVHVIYGGDALKTRGSRSLSS